jgi:hypothetical protein
MYFCVLAKVHRPRPGLVGVGALAPAFGAKFIWMFTEEFVLSVVLMFARLLMQTFSVFTGWLAPLPGL